MEVHWGIYHYASDCLISTDDNGDPAAVSRIASPQFIQDDNGKYYMFFEAGSRLNSNIAYMKEADDTAISPDSKNNSVPVYPSIVRRGEKLTVNMEDSKELSVEIIDVSGKIIFKAKLAGSSCDIQAPAVPGLYFVKVNQTGISKIVVR
jgi:hypothetical protein